MLVACGFSTSGGSGLFVPLQREIGYNDFTLTIERKFEMEFFKEVLSILKSNQPRKFMYTLLLFLSLCIFIPSGYKDIFHNVDIGFLEPKHLFYTLLFVVSFLIVDIITLFYKSLSDSKNIKLEVENKLRKQKEEKDRILETIANMDDPAKNILFSFIDNNSQTQKLRRDDPHVRVLSAKQIIIDCGFAGQDYDRNILQAYYISPKYFKAVKLACLSDRDESK